MTYSDNQKLKQGESDLQQTIIDAAHLFGWRAAHFRTVRIARANGQVYYATPVQADGAGWPDLVLAKPGRLLFVEVKSDKGKLSPEQTAWKVLLEMTGQGEVYTWRPSQWDEIEAVLRGQEGKKDDNKGIC